MTVIECYRFVNDDLTSSNGDMSWRVGEWNRVDGAVVCCSNGLHASSTPRDSLRNVHGRRWFIAEARGEVSHEDTKFAAGEMRLVEEVPAAVLRRFAVGCARRAVDYLEERHPVDARILRCVQAAEGFLDGTLGEDDLLDGRRAAGAVIAGDTVVGPDTGRAVAAALSASRAANGDAAAWAASAAGAAYAAHVCADAIGAAADLVAAFAGVHNVAAGVAAANAADRAAVAARTAASAGAVAHAAAVAAHSGVHPPDTAADRYYAAWAAYSAHPVDSHYLEQNAYLLGLIADSRA